jgi:hypothetical protein
MGCTETRSPARAAIGWKPKIAPTTTSRSTTRFMPWHHRQIGKKLNQ